MYYVLLILIVVATTFPYLKKIGWLPGFAPYLVEILAGIILLYVVAMGVRDRFRFVRPAYWFAFGVCAVTILCGILSNAVEAGPMFAGLRTYLRAIPLFFLPAVFAMTDRQLRVLLLLILAVCVVQVPITVTQSMRPNATGDAISGTLMISSMLSIFLICAACVLAGLYLKKRLSRLGFLAVLLLLVFPTTINETKGTLVLLPLGLVTTFLVCSRPGTRLRNAVLALSVSVIFGAIFVSVYDNYIQPKRPYPQAISTFLTNKGKLELYLSKDADIGVTSRGETGRIDSIVVPLRVLAGDPSQLVFGLGIGNASDSALGPHFTGRYFRLFQYFLKTSFTRLILEVGLLGCAMVMVLYWLIFNDSRVVAANDNGLWGALAAGWVGVSVVIAAATFYIDIIISEALSCLFWYFSGLIAAERMRLTEHALMTVKAKPDAAMQERTSAVA
jgi:hypothetical protein